MTAMTREEAIAVLTKVRTRLTENAPAIPQTMFDQECAEQAAALTLGLSALSGNAEGWVLVPREPTKEMIAAGFIATTGPAMMVSDIYRAMLDAAPQPTTAIPDDSHGRG
jgi:hypothetical protein